MLIITIVYLSPKKKQYQYARKFTEWIRNHSAFDEPQAGKSLCKLYHKTS